MGFQLNMEFCLLTVSWSAMSAHDAFMMAGKVAAIREHTTSLQSTCAELVGSNGCNAASICDSEAPCHPGGSFPSAVQLHRSCAASLVRIQPSGETEENSLVREASCEVDRRPAVAGGSRGAGGGGAWGGGTTNVPSSTMRLSSSSLKSLVKGSPEALKVG